MAKVYVELDLDTMLPIRIFKNLKATVNTPSEKLYKMDRGKAVGVIRLQVIARAIRDKQIRCEFCDKILTPGTGHMHEVVSRGNGGEISLDNSRFICPECHIGPTGEHSNRQWNGRKI